MLKADLLFLLGADSMAQDLFTSAQVMLGRGQSNCAMSIIIAGLIRKGITNWEKENITNKGIFEALQSY